MSTQNDKDVRILIAEDSPTQAEQLRFLLEERGYSVMMAPNGRKALEAAMKERPALIISDVVMPELDGYGFCSEIKTNEELRDIPFILLTSLASPNDVIKGLECGADFFLRKPYDDEHLLSRIDSVLSNRNVRAGAKKRGELEVVLSGEHHSINSGRQQILDLLVSTYEEAVRINEELVGSNRELELRSREIQRASHFKDQFLSTMSHELRTPLNAVLGFSELLADARQGALTDRQRRYVNHIHVSGQHLLRLINDILDLSRIEAGRLQLTPEDVPLRMALAEVSDALQPLLDKRSHQLTHSAAPELVARADATRLRQILMNLIGNAIKFTPEGGKIEVSASQAGEFVRIDVRDSGPGIPPEEKQRIFEAFHRLQQSDKAAEGTGLGLAITRSLVELHGGTLDLESELGCGSCFFFTLPSGSMPPARVRRAEEPGTGFQAEAKVLIIEDDPTAADLLDCQLTSAGCEVVICTQPLQAVEMAAELQPDAITLDILMLPVNGWDTLATLKADPRTANIPVIIVTVTDQRATGALFGSDDYIVKPVDRSILLAALDRCLNAKGKSEGEKSILVVEDDPATSELMAELLSNRGFAVKTVTDGQQARLHMQTSLPGLVILDLNLPQVSGFQLLAEWRSEPRTANVPVFVLTNKDLTQDEKEYLRANTGALFSKQEKWLEALVKQITQSGPAV
ncbi:MAG TPA: response regulator [Acidobacteriaceae bacterium]|jgi:signal transduction histidine kinase